LSFFAAALDIELWTKFDTVGFYFPIIPPSTGTLYQKHIGKKKLTTIPETRSNEDKKAASQI
jgi:hypothetical protein